MRILLTLHHALHADSGAPGSTLRLAEEYRNAGHTVDLWSFDDLPKWLKKESRALSFPWMVSARLRRAASQYDVTDCSTADAWRWSKVRPAGGPLLVTRSHGLEHPVAEERFEEARRGQAKLSLLYRVYRGGLRLREVATSLRGADLCFFLNAEEQAYAVEKLGVDRHRTRVTPNGLPEYLLALPVPPALTTDAPLRVAWVGTWTMRKGIAYAAPAIRRFLEQHPTATVSLLGTVCDAATVYADFPDTLQARLQVVPRFEHAALPTLLAGHEVMLHAALMEGFGKAIIEAMACGLVPVATATPGPLSFLTHERDALLVPTRDATALADALERLAANPALRERLRRAAHARAQEFGWSHLAHLRLGHYEAALAARSHPETVPA